MPAQTHPQKLPVEAAAATFNALHDVATSLSLSPSMAAATANQGALKLTGVNLLELLGKEHLAGPDAKRSIRAEILNDGEDTIVYRAEDICKAVGIHDYFLAMQTVPPESIVTFSHPDTDAAGLGYASVTWKGAMQLLDAARDGDYDFHGRIQEVRKALEDLRAQMLAT